MRRAAAAIVLVTAVAGCSLFGGSIPDGSYDCWRSVDIADEHDAVTVTVSGSSVTWDGNTSSYGEMPDNPNAILGRPGFGITASLSRYGFTLHTPPGTGIGSGLDCWAPGARPETPPGDS